MVSSFGRGAGIRRGAPTYPIDGTGRGPPASGTRPSFDPHGPETLPMHFSDASPSSPAPAREGAWWRELTGYQWFVFVVASLGWLFDTMDQQLFNLARQPAITELVGAMPGDAAAGGRVAEA